VLEIIQNDLHCNAVKICGQDTGRVMTTAQAALRPGLEAWLSPELWDEGQDETLRYITRAAREAESLHQRWPGRVVLSVGTELTLFRWDMVERNCFAGRISHPRFTPSTACETGLDGWA